jgi:hypothetical protein
MRDDPETVILNAISEVRNAVIDVETAVEKLVHPTWEYLALDEVSADIERLSVEGDKGWELVGVVQGRVIFKRRKP